MTDKKIIAVVARPARRAAVWSGRSSPAGGSFYSADADTQCRLGPGA
jgi:hypothetical protein